MTGHFLAGQLIPAGFGYATALPDCDCETYSEAGFVWDPTWIDRTGEVVGKWFPPKGVSQMQNAGLFAVGATVYTEHPTADVLWFSYDLKDGRGKRRWRPGLPNPQELFDYLAAGGLMESHNCGFEFWVWYNILRVKYGWPMIATAQQRCSMAKARAFGLPGGLDAVAKVLGTTAQKDAAGKDLLKRFSQPRNPDRKNRSTRTLPADDPIGYERLGRYCDQDVETESGISERIPDITGEELEWWTVDQFINRRGVQVDVAGIENCIAIIEAAFERYNGELRHITGGAVERATELPKLKDWIMSRGIRVYSMDEEAVTALIAELEAPFGHVDADVLRALKIRQLVGSSSVLKLYAMRNQTSRAGRLHELFSYHAARTGRTTGNGPQPTNLPNSDGVFVRHCHCGRYSAVGRTSCPWCGSVFAPAPPSPPPPAPPVTDRTVVEWSAEAASDALEIIATRSLEAVEWYFGDAVAVVSACLRGLYVAAAGYELISADYTAIEAVVLAQLAGEQWRIDLFNAGGKIYEASGAKICGVSYDEVVEYKKRTGSHHPARKRGKIGELAGGYQGWINAYKQFGADEFMTDDEIKDTILAWRKASPMIVKFWGGQYVDSNGMPCPSFFRDARPMLTGLEGMAIAAVLNPGNVYEYRGIEYHMHEDVLYCRLLSGRRIAYHRPRLRPGDRGGFALSYEGWNTNPKNGPRGWIRMDTYGGKLTENVVQATARDILVPAIVRLWRAGYATVLHVYDEIVAEVLQGWGSVEEFLRLMSIMPSWAHDWPIRAAGAWRGFRFRK